METKMRKGFLMIMVSAALVGCTKNEMIPVDSDEKVEIALHSNVIDASGVATRAPFEGGISSGNLLKARVIASKIDYANDPRTDGTMTFSGTTAVSYDKGAKGSTTFDGSNPVYLFGLYPAVGWEYTAGGEANFTFTGKEDVMASERIETKRDDVDTNAYKTLHFRHLLTKLEIKLYAAAAAIDVFGPITSIKLVGDKTDGTTAIPNQMKVVNNTSSMAPTLVTNAVTSLDFYGLSLETDSKKKYSETPVSSYVLTTEPSYVGYSLVAPVDADTSKSEEYFLAIGTKDGVKYIGVDLMSKEGDGTTAFTGNTAGRSFGISIYFKSNSEIMVKAEVTDWIEEGEFKGEITQ